MHHCFTRKLNVLLGNHNNIDGNPSTNSSVLYLTSILNQQKKTLYKHTQMYIKIMIIITKTILQRSYINKK